MADQHQPFKSGIVGWKEAEEVVRHRLDRRLKYHVSLHWEGGKQVAPVIRSTIPCPSCSRLDIDESGCLECGYTGKRVRLFPDLSRAERVVDISHPSLARGMGIICHALGNPKHRAACDDLYRNSFYTYSGDEACNALVDAGYMTKSSFHAGVLYKVTEPGREALRSTLPIFKKWLVCGSGEGEFIVYAETRSKARAKVAMDMEEFWRISFKAALRLITSVKEFP